MIFPPLLQPNATLAIVSPASTPKPELVHAGIAALQSLGYQTRLYPHALGGGPLYYAGPIEHRVADLHAAFADPTIDAVLCTRGGWGSAELLPHLDASLIRANPKPFIGYSDHTSLHTWFARQANLATFYGPMVAADFARPNGHDPLSWRHALAAATPWSLTASDGLRTLRPGTAHGTLAGGCISIFATALGTPYAPLPAPPGAPQVLFLEDIGTKPYQWDRMLLHLDYAGMLANVSGIVFGDMRQCVPPHDEALLDEAILHALRNFSGPIAIGLRSGHVDAPNITLPLGTPSHLDLTDPENPTLHFLPTALQV